ncbi:MAG: hypothetical protein PUE01_02530 [Clostridiaceae bacterium]|nr:hypothetical protein [Clostridiaceae bacterium]
MKKKSLKEKIMENKLKILIGGIFIAGIGTWLVLDHKFDMNVIKYMKKNNELNSKNNDRISTLYEAATEGLFEEAIATCTRKLNTRLDTISRLEKVKDLNEAGIEKLMKAKTEAGIFQERIDKFTEAQKLWGIEE